MRLILPLLLLAVTGFAQEDSLSSDGSWSAWGGAEAAMVPVAGTHTGTFGIRGGVLIADGALTLGGFANTVISDVSRRLDTDTSAELDYNAVGLLVEPRLELHPHFAFTLPLRVGAGYQSVTVKGVEDSRGGGGFAFLSGALAAEFDATHDLGFWIGGGYTACPWAEDPAGKHSDYRGPHLEFGVKYGTISGR